MKVYLITDKERQALLDKLELTSFLAARDQFIHDGMTVNQIAEAIHRRFMTVVCQALDSI